MKYRILYLIALFAMFACSEQLGDKYSIDKGLETTISVVIPQLPDAHPQSRAMGLNPQLENLKLAVFDNNGYLLEYVSATLTNEQKATENEKEYGYTVTLRPTDFRTYIHFIGNAPENIQYGTETESIGSLFTEGGKEAYWQRIELPDGIKKDGENFVESVVDSLSNVRLVRNFAWIMLENIATNFSMDSYCVVNTYNKGSIAPYNTALGEFADFAYLQTHNDLLSEGYIGFIPAGAELNTAIPEEENWFQTEGEKADEYAYFIYEREKAFSNPPYILVKGTYTAESGTQIPNCYYKVDLRDQYGNYFPLIRNFRYKVRITKVMHEGHRTAALAAAGSGSGDVSTALETEDFTNISNGVARIFVSYTDTTLVEPTDDLKLRYKFMVFKTTDANGTVITPEDIYNDPEHVTIKKGEGNLINSLDRTIVEGADGWGEIAIKTIDATEWDGKSKTQDLIIKGKVTIGTGDNQKTYELQRKVTITLTPKYTMKLKCNPTSIDKKQGTPFDVIIQIPADLRPDMFPLDIQLEADNQSMTPDKGDDLPVITGESIISANKTTIGFIKQIHWDDYAELIKSPVDGYVSFACNFKRNKLVEEGVVTNIYADNKYFVQKSTTLGSYTSDTFSGSFTGTTSINPGEEVMFKFSVSDRPEQGEIYVTLEGLEPAKGEEDILKWDENLGCYKYAVSNLSNKSGSFKLTPDGTSNPASVKLSAYHFEDYKASINVLQFNNFTNLDFNRDNLIAGSEDNVTFTFKMSVVPSYDVFVTLTNLVPADTETKLELVDANTGKYKFKTRPTGTSASITLKNTATEAGTGTVKLTSLYFNNAEESIDIKLNEFSGLTFSPSSVTNGANTPVTFSFNMPTLPSPANVTVTLDGLEPNDSDLTYIKDNADGSKQYTYTPSTTGTRTFDLKTTIDNGTASVKLEASQYNMAQKTLNVSRSYTIPAGYIRVSVEYDIYLYASNPGTSNRAQSIGNFKPSNASDGYRYNGDDIEISAENYQSIIGDGDDTIWFRYYKNTGRNQGYYIASAKLSVLMNGEVTLNNFTRPYK